MRGGSSLPGRALTLSLSLLLAVVGLGAVNPPAVAATVYEIQGAWVNPPATISRGNPVVAEWRINVNDDRPAPSNDPVENVTATFTVAKAFFEDIPDMCKTTGVTPRSSISTDGMTLTCNFGTVRQGTAIILQTPVVANGVTNEEVVIDGTSPSGEKVTLPPIPIRNPFVMDMQWGGTTAYEAWNNIDNPLYVDVDLEWSLRLGEGSDPGPDSITQRLTLTDSNGRPVTVGTHPNVGDQENQGKQGCTSFDMWQADGHPWSHRPGHPQSTSFVDSCTLTPVPGQPGVFDLTLTGINYDLLNVPRLDSYGKALPTDWNYVASGMVWFRVLTSQAGSLGLQANAPTYTAPTGQTSADLAGNNTSSKVYTLPGGFSSAYIRWYTGNGGTPWDDTYRVAAGTTVATVTTNWLTGSGNPDPTARYGVCQAFDTQFVDFDPTVPIRYFYHDTEQKGFEFTDADRPGVVEYYTGGVGDPNAFNCGTGSWSNALPADPTTVTAVRWTYPASAVEALNARGFQFWVPTRIQDNVRPGQDVWMFGSYQANGTWPPPADMGSPLTSTPNYRYSSTNGRRDVLVVVTAIPAIRKTSPSSTVTPGVPADFTLTYSANGAGAIPPSVDNYEIRDVLPLGMTYHPGSATPEPELSTDAQGRQVLTWTLDDVATNERHDLTYQAVADSSIPPGTQLTNTAVSSLDGEDSAPASKTVTTSTNGYTIVSKTADTPYIPNVDGSGDGEGSWTVTMRSFDPLPQSYTDVIDILPYKGDFRGTDYQGSYRLAGVTFPTGSTGTVYYTTAHPATLSDDPAAPVNGAPNNPSALWTTTYTPDATAVRVIGATLAPGAVRQFRVHIRTDGANPRDTYVNRAQGRAQHTRLVMRTSSRLVVAHYYSANLKKYVQDAQGVWRDANEVADYPAFKIGDEVRYRIVITNTGQGTLTNLDITDDQFKQGAFHVDSLAPGEKRSHEFSAVIPNDATGTLVNTACATADVPEDSKIPPTINCDPAGRELVNYVTKKEADPASASPVKGGQVIHYTVSVTQQGTVPANAVFTDDLTDVLDDAEYNGDVQASLGTVEFKNGSLAWTGTVPVGQVALVTYSVTVKKNLEKLGNGDLANPVTSPGCVVRAGETIDCRTLHPVADFDLSLKKVVIGSREVLAGGKVRYGLRIANHGPEGAPAPIRLSDKLPKGLELVAARGKRWDCEVDKSKDKVLCLGDWDLAAGRKAPRVIVTTKATKDAVGRELVNVAKVGVAGDQVRANNRDAAEVRVSQLAPPSTGLRLWLRPWL